MSIIPHLLVFLYIASFCLGIASFCVTLFNRANISRAFGIEPRDLERFLLLLFAFFFTNFILFYSETFLPGSVLIDFFRVAFDCLLVATVYCAIRLNHALIMMHADRLFLIPGGLFIILWGTTYFAGEQMGAVWAITQELVADAILTPAIVGYMLVISAHQLRSNKDQSETRYLVSINIMLAINACLLYAEDLYYWLSQAFVSDVVSYPYFLDPSFLLYIPVNLFTLFYLTHGIRQSRKLLQTPVLTPVRTEAVPEESPAEEAEEVDVMDSYGISAREREVIELILEGKSNAEIADTLCISIYTVKRHINNIFRKLDVHNRVGMLRKLS